MQSQRRSGGAGPADMEMGWAGSFATLSVPSAKSREPAVRTLGLWGSKFSRAPMSFEVLQCISFYYGNWEPFRLLPLSSWSQSGVPNKLSFYLFFNVLEAFFFGGLGNRTQNLARQALGCSAICLDQEYSF